MLAGFAAACVLIVLVLQIVSAQNSPVSLALLTILISGFTSVWQFRKYGLDPLGLFCLGFLLYDGLLLLRLSLVSGTSVMLYPTSFGYETYAAAGILCIIAATAVLLTIFVWELTGSSSECAYFVRPDASASAAWFWAGICSYLTGIVLYYLQFQQYGGYLAALTMTRGERFGLAGDSGSLSYPYLAFIVPSIACLCYSSQISDKKYQRIAFYALTALWCILVLAQGDRRLVLQSALTVAGVMAVVRPQALRLRMRSWLLIVAAYCFFAVFGNARSFISAIAAGETSVAQAVAELNEEMSNDWLTPEHSEFAGPYLSLLVASSGHSERLLGSSYYESFLTVLPKFMYPGQKPELLTRQFDEEMHQGSGTISGWGYNPVAEAFVNFGVLGVALIFAFWTLYFLAIRSFRRRGEWGILLSAVLLSEAVNANRIDFRNVYWETTYFTIGLLLTGAVALVLKKLHQRTCVPFTNLRPSAWA